MAEKGKGRSATQVQDRDLWKMEGEKFESDEERVELEVEELPGDS